MPIRPEMKPLYPPPKEWKAIRERILARAGHRCECRGECGLVHEGERCGVAHQDRVRRLRDTISNVVVALSHSACSLCLGGDDECRPTLVVLTTAHLDHDPTNNDEANLRSFCQLCHLRYDRHEHAKNSADTRRRKADEASGQVGMFDAARARLGKR